MAKAYILNIKDTSGNWVGIPTLIGQKGEKGLDGVGITNITQQNKKLIVDLSNNTRKEFTISSADLPNGVDILDKITREVPTNSPSITNFKTHLNIPSTSDIKTVKDLSFTNNKLKLTMNDESSKEVVINSEGVKIISVFAGKSPLNIFNTLINVTNWKVLIITIMDDKNYTSTLIWDKYLFTLENIIICDDMVGRNISFSLINGIMLSGATSISNMYVIGVQVMV